ncbi:hypothetical protein LMB96_02395 [Limosilactobacillus reuteri]|uniref:hypothetical protein n=1 Tax=Limosilactobacillus reuteri TaxID=1598 RepID=UPI001E31B171|nr:hypothetical protein [Limosilactobacillus reuteri]MCC4421192.1 hypothetical protein [Limosilactobacillus reuteri]
MAEQHKIITSVFKNNPRNFKKQFFYSTLQELNSILAPDIVAENRHTKGCCWACTGDC